MRAKRRTNLVWGIALVTGALALLLNALNLLPAPIFDLLARAWPALLVMAGLSVILRPRVIFGSRFALLISVLLVGGVAALAFSNRATQQRDDYQEPLSQVVDPAVTLLRLQVKTLATDVELLQRVGPDRLITGQFVGSTESRVIVTYNEGDSVADFALSEQQVNELPMLENIGRGTLRIELPAGLPLDIDIQAGSGAIILNTSGLAVERMNLDLQRGSGLVTIPVYDPLASGPQDLLGTLAVREGDITVFIDPQVAARLELNRSGSGIEPVFDPTVYNYLVGDVLEARNIESAEIVVRYAITAPRGRVMVRSPLE